MQNREARSCLVEGREDGGGKKQKGERECGQVEGKRENAWMTHHSCIVAFQWVSPVGLFM